MINNKIYFIFFFIWIPICLGKLEGNIPKWQEIQKAPPNIKENSTKVALLTMRRWDLKKMILKKRPMEIIF